MEEEKKRPPRWWGKRLKIDHISKLIGEPKYNPDAWGRVAFATEPEMEYILTSGLHEFPQRVKEVRKKIASRIKKARRREREKEKQILKQSENQ